jgi:Ankyrin repeats (3 copies)
MSTPPPPIDPDDDADEQYRRASELDPSRPSEATRRAVLEHAARLAAERARRDARRRWPLAGVTRWQAIVGTAAAAALAGVMIAPQFLAPTAPSGSQPAPAAAPAAKEAPREPEPAPAPVESEHPVSPVLTFERARVPPVGAQSVPLRESAPMEAAPAAPAASDTKTARWLEQRAEADAARAGSLAQQMGITNAPRAAAPTTPRAAAPTASLAPVAPGPSAPAQASASPEALRHAAAAGDLVALKSALAGASDIEARDAQGRTALMWATLNGQADAVAELLAHGADPSGADAHGTTPLQAAVAADEREIIAMLRRYGAR